MEQESGFQDELKSNSNLQISPAKLTYLVLTFTFLILFKFAFKSRNNGVRKKTSFGVEVFPEPKPFFIRYIGSAYHFLPAKECLSKTVAWHKKYGQCMKATLANETILLIFSAEMAQPFLKSGDFGHVSKDNMFYSILKPFLGNGVLLAEESSWQNRRKILMRSMTFQSLKSYTNLLNRHSHRLVEVLERKFVDNEPHQINVQINCSILAIITEILTGCIIDESETGEAAQYHHSFQKWKECTKMRMEKPWFLIDKLWKFSSWSREHDKALKQLNSFSIRRMNEHAEKREQRKNLKIIEDEQSRSILDELVDAGVPQDELMYEMNTMLFGGHETPATTFHMFLFLMALHPKHQESCRKEVDQVFDDPTQVSNGNLSFESLNNLKWIERCLSETLRLFPPVFAFMRYLKTSVKLEYEGKNVEVPPGTNIMFVPWVIHRNENYYPNPENFDPDRFLPKECANRHSYAYLPFSAGPRNCIGWKFGMNKLKTVAAYVLRNFEISTPDKFEDIPLLPNMTLTPERDYNFIMRKRNVH